MSQVLNSDILFIFLKDITTFLIPLIMLNILVGIVSFPLTTTFFSKLNDKGYTLSHLFGPLILTLIHFIIGSFLGYFFQIPLNQNIFIISLSIYLFLNLFLFFKNKGIYKTLQVKDIITTHIVFIITLFFYYYLRSVNPEAYSIERIMDFGFVQHLMNSPTLPLEDIWYATKTLNYYYFGHLLTSVMLKLLNLDPNPGFFIVTIWYISVISTNVFSLGSQLYSTITFSSSTSKKIWAGVLSVFFTIFSGTWYTLIYVYNTVRNYLTEVPIVSFWYSDVARSIEGTITEPYFYSFIESDLHAHTIGISTGILILSIIILLWEEPLEYFMKRLVYLTPVVFGIGFMINSWDVLTLGFLFGLVFLIKVSTENTLTKKEIIEHLIPTPFIFFLTILPWYAFFESPITSLKFVETPSAIYVWILYWGPFLTIPLLYLSKTLITKKENTLTFSISKPNKLILIIFYTCTFFWAFLELFYLEDIMSGDIWSRANTYFKISTQIWLWLGILSGVLFLKLIQLNKSIPLKVFLVVSLLVTAIYPIKTTTSYREYKGSYYTGIINLHSWWKYQYPEDYAGFKYLENIKDHSDKKIYRIIEASGDSYAHNNLYSAFLGWPTPLGWPVHEWTWRGTYDGIGPLRNDLGKFYIEKDTEFDKNFMNKYKADFIIVSSAERKYMNQLNEEKLKSYGEVVFEEGEVFIVKIPKPLD